VKKKRRTYWVVDQVLGVHKERALLLNANGYDVHFFTSAEQLLIELSNKRASIIIVSDGGTESFVKKVMTELMGIPEIQGARMILATERHSKEIKFTAAVASFRDIIPMDLREKQFLQRFIFATANKQLPFIQPTAQITLNNISAVSMPARITWISGTRLRIECRVKPPIGAMLNLKGHLAKSIGVHSISLTVVENQRSHLIYRFSEAMICEWSVPAIAKKEADATMKNLKIQCPNQRCRIFICAQTADLRNRLLAQFDDPRFEVSAALQKHSLVNEPKYFTPQIVIIESGLTTGDHEVRFGEMLANLDTNTTVLIIGADVSLAKIRGKYPGRKIVRSNHLPANLSRVVLEKYAPLREEHNADKDAVYITSSNNISMAEISFSARLTKIHPVAVQVSLPFPVGQFALCKIESPLLRKTLGRDPYMKFTSTYQDLRPDSAPYNHLADGYLADLPTEDRKKMGEIISKVVTDQMNRFYVGGNIPPVAEDQQTRTPELGSIKSPVQRVAAPKQQVKPASVKSTNYKASAEVFTKAPSPKTVVASISTGSAVVKREAVGMSEIVGENNGPKIDPGKITKEDFMDLLRPASSPMTEAVDDITKSFKDTARSKHFLEAIKYISIVAFLAFMFWGAFLLMAKSYEHSGQGYTDSLRKFAPNHFKRYQNKDD
jgi:hypothetical protein